MNLLHRLVGLVNVIFLLLVVIILPSFSGVAFSLIGGTIFVLFVILLFLCCIIWGIRNAAFYWRGKHKLGVIDHILLAAGVFDGILLLLGLAIFIYIGEQ